MKHLSVAVNNADQVLGVPNAKKHILETHAIIRSAQPQTQLDNRNHLRKASTAIQCLPPQFQQPIKQVPVEGAVLSAVS